jgi:hypothetical protein
VPLAADRGSYPGRHVQRQWLAGGKRIDGATRSGFRHRRPVGQGLAEGRPQGPATRPCE